MKRRKIIALLATLTLAMSSMTAFAADGEIVGDVNYVDTTIYKVTLPTTSGMSFKLDPQGLTSLDGEDGEYDSSAAGKIVGDGTMTATNLSSVDVTLSADFYITDTDESDTLTLASDAGITDQEDKAIQMLITANDGTTDTPIYVTGTASDAATTKTFDMDAADYEFTGDSESGYKYELKDGAEGSKVDMTISGSVATDYDWSAYTGDDAKTITLNAVFKFTDADGDEISAEAAPTIPTIPTIPTTATYDCSNGTGSIAVSLGTGDSATTISKVYYGGAIDNTSNELTYTENAGTITYSVANWASQSGSTKYIKIELADGTAEVVTVSLQ